MPVDVAGLPAVPPSPADGAGLRSLPSVERLARLLGEGPQSSRVAAARAAIAGARASVVAGDPAPDLDALTAEAHGLLERSERASLQPVINATGVIVHTNLGRAPLAPAALDAVRAVGEGYSTLEWDRESGRRGSRQAHAAELLRELTGAEAALVVNNCAAATLLAAAALAGGREVVISRGQLVEIGGSYRIPDVIEVSGARLREVGTTNRTRLSDYEKVIGPETGAVMRVHPSNFRALGFVEEVEIEDLCALGAHAGVPVIDDAGSGALVERLPELTDEPSVRRSVAAGCAVVCFSGDKLLGGPQAGVMVGRAEAIERCRVHPLARAVRVDKLSLAALEATLRLYREPERALREVPVLAMLVAGVGELRARAERMRSKLVAGGAAAQVIEGSARVGGGTLPLLDLPGPVCALDPGAVGLDELAARLRRGEPPVAARAREGWLLLDPRTLTDAQADAAASSVVAALGAAP